MTKLAYTAGVTFRPCKWMHVDLAYGYVNSADPERTGSYPYVNSVLALANEQIKNVAPEYPTTSAITDFSGNYTARAHTFSIGVGFSFYTQKNLLSLRCVWQQTRRIVFNGSIVQGIERGFPKHWGRAEHDIRAELYTTFSPDYI